MKTKTTNKIFALLLAMLVSVNFALPTSMTYASEQYTLPSELTEKGIELRSISISQNGRSDFTSENQIVANESFDVTMKLSIPFSKANPNSVNHKDVLTFTLGDLSNTPALKAMIRAASVNHQITAPIFDPTAVGPVDIPSEEIPTENPVVENSELSSEEGAADSTENASGESTEAPVESSEPSDSGETIAEEKTPLAEFSGAMVDASLGTWTVTVENSKLNSTLNFNGEEKFFNDYTQYATVTLSFSAMIQMEASATDDVASNDTPKINLLGQDFFVLRTSETPSTTDPKTDPQKTEETTEKSNVHLSKTSEAIPNDKNPKIKWTINTHVMNEHNQKSSLKGYHILDELSKINAKYDPNTLVVTIQKSDNTVETLQNGIDGQFFKGEDLDFVIQDEDIVDITLTFETSPRNNSFTDVQTVDNIVRLTSPDGIRTEKTNQSKFSKKQISKVGNYDPSTGEITWTINVNHLGTQKKLAVYDILIYGNEEIAKSEMASYSGYPTNVQGLDNKQGRAGYGQKYAGGFSQPEGLTLKVHELTKDGVVVGEVLEITGFKTGEAQNLDFTFRTKLVDGYQFRQSTTFKDSLSKGAANTQPHNTAILMDDWKVASENYGHVSAPHKLIYKQVIKSPTHKTDGTGLASDKEYIEENLNHVSVSPEKDYYNYNDNSVIYRISVNADGLDLSKLETFEKGELKNLGAITIKDTLQEGWVFEKIDGQDFLIYEASGTKDNTALVRSATPISPSGMTYNLGASNNELTITFENTEDNPLNKSYVIVLKAAPTAQKMSSYIIERKKGVKLLDIANTATFGAEAWGEVITAGVNKSALNLEKLSQKLDSKIEAMVEQRPYLVVEKVAFRTLENGTIERVLLPGATFQLRKAAAPKEVVDTRQSSELGRVVFTNLEEGVKYVLKETDAPKGFDIDEKEYIFDVVPKTVNGNTVYVAKFTRDNGTTQTISYASPLEIENKRTSGTLPIEGGPGTENNATDEENGSDSKDSGDSSGTDNTENNGADNGSGTSNNTENGDNNNSTDENSSNDSTTDDNGNTSINNNESNNDSGDNSATESSENRSNDPNNSTENSSGTDETTSGNSNNVSTVNDEEISGNEIPRAEVPPQITASNTPSDLAEDINEYYVPLTGLMPNVATGAAKANKSDNAGKVAGAEKAENDSTIESAPKTGYKTSNYLLRVALLNGTILLAAIALLGEGRRREKTRIS